MARERVGASQVANCFENFSGDSKSLSIRNMGLGFRGGFPKLLSLQNPLVKEKNCRKLTEGSLL